MVNSTDLSSYAFIQNGNSFGAGAVLGTIDNNNLTLKTNNAARMTVLASGDVGIGTASPSSQLHLVADGGTASGAKLTLADNGSAYGIGWLQSIRSGSNNRLGVGEAGDELLSIIFDDSSVLTRRGFVGIGTNSPQSKLQVVGVTGDPSGTAGAAAMTSFQSGSGTDLVFGSMVGTPFTSWIQHRHATVNDSYFAIALNPLGGSVGIGTSTPTVGYKLDVSAAGGTGIRLSDSTNQSSLRFQHADNVATITSAKDGAVATSVNFKTQNTGGSLIDTLSMTAGNVGIGTTSPSEKLVVKGNASFGADTESQYNAIVTVGSANAASADRTISTAGVYRGTGAFGAFHVTNGVGTAIEGIHQYTPLKIDAGATVAGAYGLYLSSIAKTGAGTLTTAYSLYVDMPSGAVNNYAAYFGGNVGIGNATPTYTLDVTGTARATGDVSSWSDERVKKNITPIEKSLDKILKLNGVGFEWRNDEFPDKKFKKGHDIGVIAQNVEKQFPEIVLTDNEGYKSVSYQKLVAPLIEAVKELYRKIVANQSEVARELASVKAENLQLKKESAEIKARLDKIEKQLAK